MTIKSFVSSGSAYLSKHAKVLGVCSVVFCLMLLCAVPARADLSIMPTRIVFEGRDRTATIELLNQTNRTNTYRMKWLEMKMESNGRYDLVPADENNPNSVSKIVMFSPRQVTIAPHGYQTIRLSLRRPADLPSGEIRAHLGMVRLARQGPERQDPNNKDVTMEMKVNLGFSVPVIVRTGADDLHVSLTAPKLEARQDDPKVPAKTFLNITVTRDSGTFSSFGTVDVYWNPRQGSEKKIGSLTNIALYPELKERPLSIGLNETPTDGSLRVVYKGKFESEGKTWAEKTFPIGK